VTFSKFTKLSNHYHNLVLENFNLPNKISHTQLQLIPFFNPTTNQLSFLINMPFVDILCKWIIQYVVFCNWFLLFSLMYLRFIICICISVMGNSNRDTGLRQGSIALLCPSTDSVDSCPKAEPREQRGLTLPLQAGYRGNKIIIEKKTRFNPYMGICNSIGYFTLVFKCPSTPSAKWSSLRLDYWGFISAVPSLSPCYFIRTQVCLLVILPATSGFHSFL
jgi:hypothetical protein